MFGSEWALPSPARAGPEGARDAKGPRALPPKETSQAHFGGRGGYDVIDSEGAWPSPMVLARIERGRHELEA